MFLEILTAFVIIFIAELGDKSQILAMSFATKYKTRDVVIGVFIGILVNHVLAVLIGTFAGSLFFGYQIAYIVAFIFIVFAYLSLLDRGDDDTPSVRQMATPIVVIAMAFFVGELGDKTQLATFALSSESDHPYMILIGTVSAMLAVSYVGIVVGKRLGERVPDYYIRIASSVLFFVYGVIKLGSGYQSSNLSSVWMLVIVGLSLIGYLSMLYISYQQYRSTPQTTFQRVAQHLKEYYQAMDQALDILCLGEEYCGTCIGKHCLIGHTKYLLEEAKKGHHIDVESLSNKAFKDVEASRILKAIDITIDEIKDHWDDSDFAILHTIRQHLDYLLFHRSIAPKSFTEYKQFIEEYKQSISK
ncbi:TMEM165/GDT1 family protein [Candidatus Xianfuyuplasma coldseepsis]|uniref:GDT1 family protein n=1 Tax=Candidatus Xianfuyuplasma coldseepsis TaxID=2782163 RepID=A0A7L7KNE2_9MOLU|nr:TMEM165/GDT1 family protein [Xianfuyuplasma coldseepsis]QMS84230.1 TMEM165/GDT1 family protein [Xianfuyuplasma coldseepsis]